MFSCSPGIPKDTKSRVIVDENLQVKGIPDVYALGDASVCEKQPLLATAQVAQQQGKVFIYTTTYCE
jgi:NADH dehydrogenase FAD-containing subunit